MFLSIRTGTKYCAPCNATEHIQNEVKEYAITGITEVIPYLYDRGDGTARCQLMYFSRYAPGTTAINYFFIMILSITFFGTGGFLIIRYNLFKMVVC